MTDEELKHAMDHVGIPEDQRKWTAEVTRAYLNRDLKELLSRAFQDEDARHRCRKLIEHVNGHSPDDTIAPKVTPVALTKLPDESEEKFQEAKAGLASSEEVFQRGLERGDFAKRLKHASPRKDENAKEMVVPSWLRK